MNTSKKRLLHAFDLWKMERDFAQKRPHEYLLSVGLGGGALIFFAAIKLQWFFHGIAYPDAAAMLFFAWAIRCFLVSEKYKRHPNQK